MLENLTKKQKIILSIIAVLVAIGIIYFINNKNQTNNIELDENILVSNQNTKQMSQDTEKIVIVHITGSVKNPGIVKLKEGSRIEDAIEAAGGLTENADISNVNLAYVLDDGTKIKIPNLDDEDIGDEDVVSKDSGEGIIQEDEKTTNTNIVNINKYIISGIVGMLIYQQLQNIGMTFGLMPITGITLPFISYGGSSLLSYMIMIVIIFNISNKALRNIN